MLKDNELDKVVNEAIKLAENMLYDEGIEVKISAEQENGDNESIKNFIQEVRSNNLSKENAQIIEHIKGI